MRFPLPVCGDYILRADSLGHMKRLIKKANLLKVGTFPIMVASMHITKNNMAKSGKAIMERRAYDEIVLT
jgi:hypothetical protein